MSLAEVRQDYEENESIIHGMALNSVHPEHSQVFAFLGFGGIFELRASTCYHLSHMSSLHLKFFLNCVSLEPQTCGYQGSTVQNV
jgi:hypothetical protein